MKIFSILMTAVLPAHLLRRCYKDDHENNPTEQVLAPHCRSSCWIDVVWRLARYVGGFKEL
jgi:hypothetical protein